MKHALVILCGGNSVRMGPDKALLPFGDSCLIEYLVREFSPYFSNIYLSVKRKGAYAHLDLDVTEIADIYPNAGPMSGLFSALSMIHEDSAFFLSVDTPFFEPETALALFDKIGDTDICTLEHAAGSEEIPVGVYTKNIITTIGKCLLLKKFTFQELVERCHVTYLSDEDFSTETDTSLQKQLFNMDTRQDYYRALKLVLAVTDLS